MAKKKASATAKVTRTVKKAAKTVAGALGLKKTGAKKSTRSKSGSSAKKGTAKRSTGSKAKKS